MSLDRGRGCLRVRGDGLVEEVDGERLKPEGTKIPTYDINGQACLISFSCLM